MLLLVLRARALLWIFEKTTHRQACPHSHHLGQCCDISRTLQVQSAASDTVVKVTLGSAAIIPVFPSDEILKRIEDDHLDRLKWFVQNARKCCVSLVPAEHPCVSHCCRFTDRGYDEGLARDFDKACKTQMNGLWHKATVIMKMAQGGVRPFVKHVMRKLQQNVVDGLEAAGKSWDCSLGPEKFDAGPEEMEVTSINTSGVFKCKEAHEFQVSKSDPPTALEVVSPSADLVAAGHGWPGVPFGAEARETTVDEGSPWWRGRHRLCPSARRRERGAGRGRP